MSWPWIIGGLFAAEALFTFAGDLLRDRWTTGAPAEESVTFEARSRFDTVAQFDLAKAELSDELREHIEGHEQQVARATRLTDDSGSIG